jgi:hypothetical protein
MEEADLNHNVVFNSNRFNYIQFQIVLHCQLVLQMSWWEPCRFVSVIVIIIFLWSCGIMMTVFIWFTLIIVLIISHLPVMKIRRCFYLLEVNSTANMSEWLLFSANSAIFQQYHGENKLIFNEMMMRSALY